MTTRDALVQAGKRQRNNAHELARIAFVARVLDPSLETPKHWLPIALARLGDHESAKELCQELWNCAKSDDAKREAGNTIEEVRAAQETAPVAATLTLAELRAHEQTLRREIVALVTPSATGHRIPCPKCNGTGGIPEYDHIEAGLCFLCHGQKTIRSYAARL